MERHADSAKRAGIDIIAYTMDASHFIGVQVKALSKSNPVPLGTSLERCMGNSG
jgi:hypothetical protein